MRAIDWLAPIRNRVPSIYRPRSRRRKKFWQPIAAQVERMEDRTLLSSAPIFDAPSYSFSIGDDAISGQAVGTVSATDPDPGDMVMYSITDGDPGGVFSIDPMMGQISVMDETSLNGGQTYVLTVEASDGLLSDSVSVTIDVVETNLPPVFDEPSYAFPLGDDASSGTVVGTVSATDPNPSDFLSYYIMAGDPESIFMIDFMTGQISVMDPTTLDGGDTFVLTVEVSDGEAANSVSVTINVTETNLPPTFDQPSYTFDLGDDATMGQLVGTVTATDPNPSDFLTYSVTAGDPSAIFSMDFMTGQITVADPSTLNGGQVFNLTVEVSDGEAMDSVSVTINVTETNLPPTFDEPSYAFEIAEDANMGDPVGTVTASDPNPSDMLMYSITAGNTDSAFTIDSMTGAITVMNDFVLSAGQEYTLTVEVSDGEDTASVTVTINVVAGTPIPNQPPTANAGGPYVITFGQMLTLNGSGSSDPDFGPNMLTYRWDLDNDGTYDYDSGTDPNPSVDWSTLASYGYTFGVTQTVKLEVSDGVDTDTATAEVTVNPNVAPTADPRGPYVIYVGDMLMLDGSASIDPDNAPSMSLTYSWDMLNDGMADYFESSPMIPWSVLETDFAFERGNTYTVALTVDDGLDVSPTVTTTIDVLNRSPLADSDDYDALDDLVLSVDSTTGVLVNDFDLDGDTLSAVLVSGPSQATSFSLNSDGSFNYTPTVGYIGWDSFTYQAFDGLAFSAPVVAQIAVNRIIIRSGELLPEPVQDPPQSMEDLYDLAEVDPASVTERWVGELVALEVKAIGPRPPEITTHQWTVPGGHVDGFIVSEDLRHGHPSLLPPGDYGYSGIEFHWHQGSNGLVRTVAVDVTLANGANLQKSARFRVEVPLISVLADVGEVFWVPPSPANPFATTYQLGSHVLGNPAGINIDATIIAATPGDIGWVQLVTRWTSQAYFPNGPAGDAEFDFGPGTYMINWGTAFDGGVPANYPTHVGNEFTDVPKLRMSVLTAAEGGTVSHVADFSTYLLWVSDRAGSIGVPVRRVDWSWSFSANTVENAAAVTGWEWAPPWAKSATMSGAFVIDTYPEWDFLFVPSERKWFWLG